MHRALSSRFERAILAFLDRDPDRRIEIAWVPGHQDVKGNKRADRLAKAATRKPLPRGHEHFTSLTHVRRRAKAKALEAWKTEWRQHNPTGRYAAADRFEPSARPLQHFYSLSRGLYSRVTQCRTGHAFTGEYYSQFVPSESGECPCGFIYQSRRHILFECPRYDQHRHFLADLPQLDLPTVLGTKDGIIALAQFISASGAFTKTGNPPELNA